MNILFKRNFPLMLAVTSLLLLITNSFSSEEKLNVLFLSPNPVDSENEFWSKSIKYAKRAASDLNINLEVLTGHNSRFRYRNDILKIVKRKVKPDYVVMINHFGTGEMNLASLEKAKIKSVTVSTNLSSKLRSKIGLPREKYKYWLGHLGPDDIQAGYLLAKTLIKDRMKKYGAKSNVHIVGINGGRDSSVSTEREQGLRKAVNEFPNVSLHQVVHSNWDSLRASNMYNKLKLRYPKTNVIWTAADVLALGIIDNHNINLDKFSIGGIDWTNKGVKAIDEKKMTASIGNHFLHIALSLVLIKDHASGHDFKEKIGMYLQFPMQKYDPESINLKGLEKQNFRDFSFHYKPNQKRYDFTKLFN